MCDCNISGFINHYWIFGMLSLELLNPILLKKNYFNKDVPIIDCGYGNVFFQYQSDISMKDPTLIARLV